MYQFVFYKFHKNLMIRRRFFIARNVVWSLTVCTHVDLFVVTNLFILGLFFRVWRIEPTDYLVQEAKFDSSQSQRMCYIVDKAKGYSVKAWDLGALLSGSRISMQLHWYCLEEQRPADIVTLLLWTKAALWRLGSWISKWLYCCIVSTYYVTCIVRIILYCMLELAVRFELSCIW